MNVIKAHPLDFDQTMFVTPDTLGAASATNWYWSSEYEVVAIFVRLHRDSVRFVRDLGRWFVWCGDHWQCDWREERIPAAVASTFAAYAQLAVAGYEPQEVDPGSHPFELILDPAFRLAAATLLRHRPELCVQTKYFNGGTVELSWVERLTKWIEAQPYEAIAGAAGMLEYDLSYEG